jgi:hypothetical protein
LLCKSSFFPEDVETFVEFLIEPSEVKEYEKEALTQDSVRQAQQDVEKIILKQACEEIEKIKTVVHAGFYHEVKSPCSIKPMQAYPQTHQYPSYQYQQNQYYMQYPQYQQYQQYPQYPQYQQYQQYPQYPQYQQYQQYQQYPQYPAPQQSQRQQYQ